MALRDDSAVRTWLAELEVKAAAPGAIKAAPAFGGTAFWWGVDPIGWATTPGSRMDYARIAGDFRRNGTVAIVLRWLEVNALSGPKLCVGTQDRKSGKYDENPDHELTTDLKRPNPFFPASTLIGNTVKDLAYPGYSYWIKGKGELGRLEYYWVPTYTMTPVPSPVGTIAPIAYYEYQPIGGGLPKRYEVDQVIHFRNGCDPWCPWQGLSPLAAQIRSVAALNAGETWTAAVLRKGHRATLISPREGQFGNFDEQEMQALRKRLQSQSSGDEAGGLVGTESAIETHPLGFSPEEVLIDRILDRPEGMVLASSGVNSLVTGLPSSHDTRTYSNLGEAKVQAAEYGLKPPLSIIAETLQTQALPDYEDMTSEVWWDYSDYTPLQEDADARANRANVLFDGGISTLNEARELAGLPLIEDERGDQFKSEIGMAQAQQMAELTAGQDRGGDSANTDTGPRALNPPEEDAANAA